MKHKQLLWLIAVLAVLLVVAFLSGVFDGDVSTVEVPEVNVPADRVTAIRLRTSEHDVRVEKQNSLWMLLEPISGRADSASISELLEDISSVEIASVVSRSRERYGRYGVDSSGSEVFLTWDGGEVAFVIGNRGPDNASNYVRMAGDERVFLTRSAVNVPTEIDRLRDKTIFVLDVAGVSEAIVNGPDKSYVLSRERERWAIEGQPADSASVRRWFDRFAPIRADGFFESAPAASDSAYVVTFDGRDVRTLRFVPHEGDFAVEGDESGTVYRIRAVRIDQFVPEESFFGAR